MIPFTITVPSFHWEWGAIKTSEKQMIDGTISTIQMAHFNKKLVTLSEVFIRFPSGLGTFWSSKGSCGISTWSRSFKYSPIEEEESYI